MSDTEKPFKVAQMQLGDVYEWDGVSPINGAAVVADISVAGFRYVFTQRSCFLVHQKPTAKRSAATTA